MDDKLPQKIDKPWGYELLWAHTPRYAGKMFFVKKGHRLSLHYHEKKDETLYIYEGKVLLEIEGKNGRLVQSEAHDGHCFRIPPRTKHRMKAIEDTFIFEVSTPELEDTKRFEDDYGRA
jgi:mannose-6-phosphate isomerase